jgi:ATP-dependent exoDNAse (exonuclease V) beta subunit
MKIVLLSLQSLSNTRVAKTFHIYRSSAGSGKTRTLAKSYLKLALKSRSDYFKHILAVTFANKATQEMKDRILAYLDDFANGRENELAVELKAELKFDDQTFRSNAQEVQSAILHKYSLFSISTIDAFFQRVIRSFTRESGLVGDYRLEVDQDAVLEEVINDLIDELGNHEQLTKWVVDFAKENLENDRAWDVRQSLKTFAEQIFREEFKAIESELSVVTAQPDFINNLLVELKKKKFEFVSLVRVKSGEALELIHKNGLDGSDFKYGGGAYNFFQKINKISRVKDFDETQKGKRPEKEFQDIRNWPDKDTTHKSLILKLTEEQLLPLLNDILNYWNSTYKHSLSAEVVLNNFYAFGLIADISRKLNEYKNQNNLMLLADAPKFLHGVIQDSDTPFIYEKVGSFYKNYLIDEFQDTSGYQWKNFLPLLKNGIDQGYSSLVVGDVKQAIYRWRGGDLNLLQEEVENTIGPEIVEVTALDTNYRSAANVVDFNNIIFKTAAEIIGEKVEHDLPVSAFKDVTQQIFRSEEEGFVQLSFIREEGDEEKWKEKALLQVPEFLEELQEKGISLKDIAILVRKNDEGQKIAAHLLQYKNSSRAKPNCKYDVISNESLRLDGAAAVNLLLGAMKYLFNPEDPIARAQLGFEFARINEPEKKLAEVFAVGDHAFFEHSLPQAFTREKGSLKKLPLFELTETLIEIFRLGGQQGELTYLLAFQDLVLDFYSRERNDLGAFLEWWEENKHKKSIQVSGEVDAVQIISIHRSKGLQFKYVIIPFCSWNMDHDPMKAPLLWVKSEEPPFRDAGYLPVAYSSTLEETCFKEYYEKEFTRIFLDNLNLLYVAFTRAEKGLIISAPHPKSVNRYTVASLLHDCISRNVMLQQHWNESFQIWKKGSYKVKPDIVNNKDEDLSLLFYPVSRWRDKLVIKQSGKGFFTEEIPQVHRMRYGVHMHAVLSRLKFADDVSATMDRIYFEGLIKADERGLVSEQVNELMQNPTIANWFSKDWDVRTEVPILLPGGAENRIDRLMIKGKTAIVVDFKTGDPAKADQAQVLAYMQILRQMNFIEITGYLVYLRRMEVVPVPLGKIKTLKQKVDNQLGLPL